MICKRCAYWEVDIDPETGGGDPSLRVLRVSEVG